MDGTHPVMCHNNMGGTDEKVQAFYKWCWRDDHEEERWSDCMQTVLSKSSHRFGGVVFPLSVNLQEEEQNE